MAFRLIKPTVTRHDNYLEVNWVEHQFKDGTWGSWAAISIYLRRKDWLEKEAKVEINWSAVGSTTIEETAAFAKGLDKAVRVAKKEYKKLLKEQTNG